MPHLLQLNTSANWGSTGTIAENIALAAQARGWTTEVAYGRMMCPARTPLYRIDTRAEVLRHALLSRLTDSQGLHSADATRRLIRHVEETRPDVIHLHNIHGYYLHYPLLFEYLRRWGGPVVWTLHDCWPLTGHCAYYTYIGCDRWQTECHDCPSRGGYPTSWFVDRSRRQYALKRRLFSALAPQLTLVPVSQWLADFLPHSFLREARVRVIHNGIDTTVFRPRGERRERIILGVASVWGERKGLSDFVRLAPLLPEGYRIVLVGLNSKELRALPPAIEGIARTESLDALARLYARAAVFVNPTWEDNFPTTNLEALASGTPVVTYRTGGSVEAVSEETGLIVEQGDTAGLARAIRTIVSRPAGRFAEVQCRERALSLYRREDRFEEYLRLYDELLKG